MYINKGFVVWSVTILVMAGIICFLSTRNITINKKTGRPRFVYKQLAFDLLAVFAAFVGFVIMIIGCSVEFAEGISFLVFQSQHVNPLCVVLSVLFVALINVAYFLILHYLSIAIQKRSLAKARGKQHAEKIVKLASRPRKVKIMS